MKEYSIPSAFTASTKTEDIPVGNLKNELEDAQNNIDMVEHEHVVKMLELTNSMLFLTEDYLRMHSLTPEKIPTEVLANILSAAQENIENIMDMVEHPRLLCF